MQATCRPTLLVVAPSAYLLGGVQTWLDYVVPGLEVYGWHVYLLLVDGTHSSASEYLKVHPFENALTVRSLSGSREGRIRALRRTIRQVSPDLVLNVNIVDTYEAVLRYRKGDGSRARVVAALHGLGAGCYQDVQRWRTAIDAVVATNRLSVAAVKVWGGMSSDRVHYAPCGVDIPEVTWPTGNTLLQLLFAGRFEDREKRVRDLPCLLHFLSSRACDFTLRLAGGGPEEAWLRDALVAYGSRVEFVGELRGDALAAFFKPDTVTVVLSPRETGPLVAFEAMAAGSTLVTSKYIGSGMEGSLRHDENCLMFDVGDMASAAEAVASLREPERRRRIGRAGRQLVQSSYTKHASIAAWDTALRQVLRTPPHSASASGVLTPSAGRLDRLFGAIGAETVREWCGLSFAPMSAGDEWPHSYGSDDSPDFDDLLRQLDQGSATVRK